MGFAELPTKYLNFAKELERLSKVGGSFTWVALRTPDLTKKCSCAGKGTKDSVPGCNRCFDTGYLFVDCLVKCYAWPAVLGVEFLTPPGKISTQNKNYVIEADRNITTESYILELDIDKDTGKPNQPFKIERAYKIQDFALIKARDDKPAFWKVSAEQRNITNNITPTAGTEYNHNTMI